MNDEHKHQRGSAKNTSSLVFAFVVWKSIKNMSNSVLEDLKGQLCTKNCVVPDNNRI